MRSQLPAVLLSGLFVFFTAGLPLSAVAAPARESIAAEDGDAGAAGDAVVTAAQELPEAVAPPPLPPSEPGLVPPWPTGTVTTPHKQSMLQHHGEGAGRQISDAVGLATHPDRGPPVMRQQ